MRDEVFAKMQRLSLGFYANRSTGELMSRVVDDVNHVERVLLDGTEQLIVAMLTLVGVAGILFSLNPFLAALALIPIPVCSPGALWYTRSMRTALPDVREQAAEMNAALHDALSGLMQVKIFNREKQQERRFYEKADEYRQEPVEGDVYLGLLLAGDELPRLFGKPLGSLCGGGRCHRRPGERGRYLCVYALPQSLL